MRWDACHLKITIIINFLTPYKLSTQYIRGLSVYSVFWIIIHGIDFGLNRICTTDCSAHKKSWEHFDKLPQQSN